jgi:pimeloyl-ACP methyl ester carboxylesterase
MLSEGILQDDEVQVETTAIWFGNSARPQLGWLSLRPAGIGRSGIVIAPPVGYEYWSVHRSLRALAERLARAGHCVLRIDYDGTGDSAGDQWDEDRVRSWQRTIETASAHLRGLGLEEITLLGARLGATFGLLAGSALKATRIVAWLPISGRRYAKELRLLSTPVPPDADPIVPPGTMAFAGSVFSAATIADLRGVEVSGITESPAPSILVIDEPTGPSEAVVSHLRSLGAEVSHLRLPGSEESLRTAPEFAIVPTAILDAICDWMGDQTVNGTIGDEARDSVGRPVELAWREGAVIETVLRLAGQGHVGVLTEPVATAESAPAPNSTTLVLLNPGSETHVGPGRAWVELARDLALGGRRTIRIDFLGWGESPDAGRAPGHPYDACCEQDTVAIVNDLRDAGFERVTICGLCAAAWIVLRVASVAGAAGVIALNPQMYWKRGDPVEIDWDVIRARRAAEIRRIERGARFGLWSVIDALGQRSPSARWLDELSSIGIPVHIVFAENDDGLIYLRGRLRRRLSRVLRRGHVSVRELPGVDHPMHRTWMRPHVVQALSEALQDIDAHR